MEKIKKQVCVEVKRLYDITAGTEEEFKRIVQGYAPRFGRQFLRGEIGGRFVPTANCVFVSVKCVNEPDNTYRVVVAQH